MDFPFPAIRLLGTGIRGRIREPIATAIEFINENYKSELVREDIAAAVEMNSNYYVYKKYCIKKRMRIS